MKEIDKLKDAIRFAENTTVTLKKLLEHFESKKNDFKDEDKITRLFNEIENLTEEEREQLEKRKLKN